VHSQSIVARKNSHDPWSCVQIHIRTQLALERSRADHLAAEAAALKAAATEREQLATQLEQAQREVAVKQALCDGWQRANQVGWCFAKVNLVCITTRNAQCMPKKSCAGWPSDEATCQTVWGMQTGVYLLV